MKLRHKLSGNICYSDSLNPRNNEEVVVETVDGYTDYDYTSDYEVWLPDSEEWKDLDKAFADYNLTLNRSYFELRDGTNETRAKRLHK